MGILGGLLNIQGFLRDSLRIFGRFFGIFKDSLGILERFWNIQGFLEGF